MLTLISLTSFRKKGIKLVKNEKAKTIKQERIPKKNNFTNNLVGSLSLSLLYTYRQIKIIGKIATKTKMLNGAIMLLLY